MLSDVGLAERRRPAPSSCRACAGRSCRRSSPRQGTSGPARPGSASRDLADPGFAMTACAAGRRGLAGTGRVRPAGRPLGSAAAGKGWGGSRLAYQAATLTSASSLRNFDGVGHHVLAPGPRFVSLQFEVKVDRALSGEVRHALRRADSVRAVAAGTRGIRYPLAFRNILGRRVRRPEVISCKRPHSLTPASPAGENPATMAPATRSAAHSIATFRLRIVGLTWIVSRAATAMLARAWTGKWLNLRRLRAFGRLP